MRDFITLPTIIIIFNGLLCSIKFNSPLLMNKSITVNSFTIKKWRIHANHISCQIGVRRSYRGTLKLFQLCFLRMKLLIFISFLEDQAWKQELGTIRGELTMREMLRTLPKQSKLFFMMIIPLVMFKFEAVFLPFFSKLV